MSHDARIPAPRGSSFAVVLAVFVAVGTAGGAARAVADEPPGPPLPPAAPTPAQPSATSESSGPLTLCLAAAADDSPVYPLKEVAATNHEVVAAVRLRDGESFTKLTYVWTAVDVGQAAPPKTEIARGDVPLVGTRHAAIRLVLPNAFPVGTYRLDVLAEGKAWASIEFPVVAAKEPRPLEKPSDLLPLDVGATWTYALTFEGSPQVKDWDLPGAERGPDGVFRGTATFTVAGKDDAGARVEIRRGSVLANEEWWSLDEHGLALTRERAGDKTFVHDPPVPTLPLPLTPWAAWSYASKDGTLRREARVWGPLPVVGPKGVTPGWVLWSMQPTGSGTLTLERHFVRGVGVVREVQVASIGAERLSRLEIVLQPPN